MFKKLSDTLSALVAEYCTDDDQAAPAAKSGKKGKGKSHAGRNAPPHLISDEAVPVAPITRAELIRQAMEIRDAKARELENLTPAQRQRLRKLAEKMMLGTEPGSDSDVPAPATKPPTRH